VPTLRSNLRPLAVHVADGRTLASSSCLRRCAIFEQQEMGSRFLQGRSNTMEFLSPLRPFCAKALVSPLGSVFTPNAPVSPLDPAFTKNARGWVLSFLSNPVIILVCFPLSTAFSSTSSLFAPFTNVKPFVFSKIQTLLAKHPEWGVRIPSGFAHMPQTLPLRTGR